MKKLLKILKKIKDVLLIILLGIPILLIMSAYLTFFLLLTIWESIEEKIEN